MPGSVALSAPTAVLPYGLSAMFIETYTWPTVSSDAYPDGSMQVRSDGAAVRRAWSLSQNWLFADLPDLVDFYDARKGAHEPFYFYPILSQYDATGVSTTGRYRVRFDGALQRDYQMGRWPASFKLIEIT
jgi:hypothetical protein